MDQSQFELSGPPLKWVKNKGYLDFRRVSFKKRSIGVMLRTKKPHFSLIIISLRTSIIIFSLQKNNKNKPLLFNNLSFQNVLKKQAKLRLGVLINFVLIKKNCVHNIKLWPAIPWNEKLFSRLQFLWQRKIWQWPCFLWGKLLPRE